MVLDTGRLQPKVTLVRDAGDFDVVPSFKMMPLNVLGMPETLPGLADFYLCGQWVEPGDMVPVVAMSGRNVIQLFCHVDRRPFVAALP